jgi:hypothetical protein
MQHSTLIRERVVNLKTRIGQVRAQILERKSSISVSRRSLAATRVGWLGDHSTAALEAERTARGAAETMRS